MKHIKEFQLNEDKFDHFEGSVFATITAENIVSHLNSVLAEKGWENRFLKDPKTQRYLDGYAKSLMHEFWTELGNKSKIEELSNDLERNYSPDETFFPSGVFPDPTKK